MEKLREHRGRSTQLREGMDVLESLHEQKYALWHRFIGLRDGPERDERLPELEQIHSEIADLGEKILAKRREMFGTVSRVSELDIISRVESILLSSPAEPQEAAA